MHEMRRGKNGKKYVTEVKGRHIYSDLLVKTLLSPDFITSSTHKLLRRTNIRANERAKSGCVYERHKKLIFTLLFTAEKGRRRRKLNKRKS